MTTYSMIIAPKDGRGHKRFAGSLASDAEAIAYAQGAFLLCDSETGFVRLSKIDQANNEETEILRLGYGG